MALDPRAERGEIKRGELLGIGHEDHALRVADRDVLEVPLAPARGQPPRYVACVLLATTRLDVNGVVRQRLGRKASLAGAGGAPAQCRKPVVLGEPIIDLASDPQRFDAARHRGIKVAGHHSNHAEVAKHRFNLIEVAGFSAEPQALERLSTRSVEVTPAYRVNGSSLHQLDRCGEVMKALRHRLGFIEVASGGLQVTHHALDCHGQR